jgi:hypothetical protein
MPQTNDSIPYGLCQCGCGEPAPLAPKNDAHYDLVKGQPYRFIAGHQRRKSPIPYLVENRGYKTPCWTWQRSRMTGGYGTLAVAGRDFLAHRWYYEQRYGPIPDGLVIDHLCRNRACVNPDHMEPVTLNENIRRGHSPSAVAHRTNVCQRGHPLEGRNLITLQDGRRRCRACANEGQRRSHLSKQPE